MRIRCPIAILFVLLFVAIERAEAGNLNPPGGPVAPSMKTLVEVEPRIAINATNTPGDADSLFKITQPGSYFLTSNIQGAAAKHGVEIAAGGVTLNLNGFDLLGVAGSLDGVSVTVSSLTNIAVSNGSVRNWGGDGVDLGTSGATNCRVADLLASGNTGNGILTGPDCMVLACSAKSNAAGGIHTGDRALVRDCNTNTNAQDNILVGNFSSVTNCVANSSTAGNGINASSSYCIVQGCTANGNFLDGVRGSNRAQVLDCVASNNQQNGIRANFIGPVRGCFANGNTICGIFLESGGLTDVIGNSCAENGTGASGAGIRVAANGCRVQDNQCAQNFRGIDVTGNRNIIISNKAVNNSNADFSFAAGNSFGPIITAQGAGDLSAVGGANHPTANFRF